MAQNKRTQENTAEEKAPRWVKVLKHVAVRVFFDQTYVLVKLTDEQMAELDAESPVEIEYRDGVMLLNISRFAKFAVLDEVLDQADCAGKGWANIKIRHAEYDYTYKGKRGHTSKLELIGCRFLTLEKGDALSGLADDDEDPTDLEDLPF